MRKQFLLAALSLAAATHALAQTDSDTVHVNKVYVVSGMGWGFSLGETDEVLNAKFSSSLGLDFSLPNKRYFLYPSLDFLTFGYDQQVHDPNYVYDLERGRSNFYILNLAGGVRKQLDKLNVYAFAGPGAGFVVEPRAEVRPNENRVIIRNSWRFTPAFRGGVGADYKLGGFFLFVETGWLHNFRNIQDRSVNVVSVYGGIKTDVTRIKDNVAKMMGID